MIRQTGSHARLETEQQGQHRVTIPMHGPLRIGTVACLLSDVASHFEVSRDELLERLFSKDA